VLWICVDKDRVTSAARNLHNLRFMVEELEKVDPRQMTHEQKLAFWINIYNALTMHAYLAYGIPQNPLKRLSLLQKVPTFNKFTISKKKDTSLFAHLCRWEFASPDFDFCSMRYSIESYDLTEEK
jgi:hypothetical protein